MKLKDLVKKLAKKPGQNVEVQFCVWTAKDGTLVCVDMNGQMTQDLMKIFAKHAPSEAKL
jgi:hypothetical protein